jgi:hypothetical protein
MVYCLMICSVLKNNDKQWNTISSWNGGHVAIKDETRL